MSRYEQKNEKNNLLMPIMLVLVLGAVILWVFVQNQQSGTEDIRTIEVPEEKQVKVSDVLYPLATDDLLQSNNTLDAVVKLEPKHVQEVLPTLEHSDEFIRERLAVVSEGLLSWVQVDEVLKKYFLIINDLSQNQVVFKHRSFIKPLEKIRVKQDSQGLYLAKSSYKRYDNLANAIAAIDTDKAIHFYLMFKPLFEQVYREFSYPVEYQVQDVFLKAAASVMSAPIIETRISLIPHSIRYKFADEKLESLNDVKKQMIRMGPENTRKIQNMCRKLVQAFSKLPE